MSYAGVVTEIGTQVSKGVSYTQEHIVSVNPVYWGIIPGIIATIIVLLIVIFIIQPNPFVPITMTSCSNISGVQVCKDTEMTGAWKLLWYLAPFIIGPTIGYWGYKIGFAIYNPKLYATAHSVDLFREAIR